MFYMSQVERRLWFCRECGEDFEVYAGCSCIDEDVDSNERLSLMMSRWGMESERFDSYMAYPRNWLLVDVGSEPRFYTTMTL